MFSISLKGCGIPLVMLHGWGQSHQSLIPLAELLTDISNPCLVDLPGFGQTPPPSAIWSAHHYAKELIEHLDSKGIQEFFLLGHSFGGKVSLCTALNFPNKVKKLVLIAPSGLRAKKALGHRIKMRSIVSAGKVLKKYDNVFGTEYFSNYFVPKFGSSDYRNAGQMRSILVKSVNEDLSDSVKEIKTETLLLWGERDTETPLEMGQRLSKLMPNAQLCSFAHHDHQLFQDVGAHLCVRYIKPFLLKEGV